MNLGAHMFAETEMTLETGLEAGSCKHSIEFILRAESWQLSRLAGITGYRSRTATKLRIYEMISIVQYLFCRASIFSSFSRFVVFVLANNNSTSQTLNRRDKLIFLFTS